MQLCDVESLNEMLSLNKPQRRSNPRLPRRVSSEDSYQPPAARCLSRRCQCGVCHQCQENARWERIYQEKFADPHYYSRPQRRSSPLSL